MINQNGLQICAGAKMHSLVEKVSRYCGMRLVIVGCAKGYDSIEGERKL